MTRDLLTDALPTEPTLATSGALKLVMGCILVLEEGGDKEFQAYPVKTFPFRVHCPIVQD